MNRQTEASKIPSGSGLNRAITGCLLGTAVADAVGLPYEGLSRRRASRLLGPPTRHRFLFGRGMVSDDTEHACMLAASLLEAGPDEQRLADAFARRLKGWLVALPPGAGRATLLSCLKLLCGVQASRSGVDSAGNGPAMRSALLGLVAEDLNRLRRLVRSATRITHTDPQAEAGAFAVALAARESAKSGTIDPNLFFDACVQTLSHEPPLLERLLQVSASVRRGESTARFAESIGCGDGVSGYINDTVPVALHAWLRYPADFRLAVSEVIQCGGDADTTAAIVGAIVGANVGPEGIDSEWVRGLVDRPWSVSRILDLGEELASSLQDERPRSVPASHPVAVLPRNLLFLLVVLIHGFRRLAPPY